MPKMDGIESTRRIRELGFKAPIVALTAFDHETNRNACYEAGMNGEYFEYCNRPQSIVAISCLQKLIESQNFSLSLSGERH